MPDPYWPDPYLVELDYDVRLPEVVIDGGNSEVGYHVAPEIHGRE